MCIRDRDTGRDGLSQGGLVNKGNAYTLSLWRLRETPTLLILGFVRPTVLLGSTGGVTNEGAAAMLWYELSAI